MQSNDSLDRADQRAPRARFLGRRFSVSVTAAALSLAGATADAQGMTAASHEPPTCSNRSLRGDYGFAIEGTILAGPAAGLLRGVAMTRFDGRGHLSQIDFTTRNGVPFSSDWRPGSGTYEINADCTGSALITPDDGSPALHLRLVVVDDGKQVLTIVEGNATGSRGIKVR